jgi:catechol 2,3-dioxygenase-like lactoylglutathione lyase family enzyme
MNVGSFYPALTVKNLQASRAFYEKLGFVVFDGKEEDNWLMLRNGDIKIGLFQGMFDKNLLTFHPPDVRAIQHHLKASGITLTKEADETTTGPEFITLTDPDGNDIMFDQF